MIPLSKTVQQIYHFLGDFIFPRHCLACQRAMEGQNDESLFIHDRCHDQLYEFDELTGRIRGAPLGVSTQVDRASVMKTSYEEGRAIWEYRGLGRELIRELKYLDGRYLRSDLKYLIGKNTYWRDFLMGAILVPVPLHRSRLRKRGFNQSEWIAELLKEIEPSLRIENILKRTQKTIPQVELHRKERLKNLEKAFSLKQKLDLDRSTRYVLIDDVYTTGSTINACAKILKRAGVERIDFLTLAHG